MARFVSVNAYIHSTDVLTRISVNLDLVRYMEPAGENSTVLHFDDEHTLQVEAGIAEIERQARGGLARPPDGQISGGGLHRE